MASLPAKIFDFQANIPVTSLDPLDAEFQQIIDILNGTATGTKLLVKASDASDPVIESDQLGAGPLAEWKQNGTLKTSIANSGQIVSAVASGTAPLSVSSTTVVTNLNADTVDGIQGSNIAKLDTHKTLWAATFIYPDMSTRAVDIGFDQIQGALIPGANFTLTHVAIKPASGTATGTFSIDFRKVPSGSMSQTTLATFDVTDGVIGVAGEIDVADHTFTAGDWIYPVVTAVSSPAYKMVWVSFRGYQTFTT
jgi:hypothetical protein